MNVSVNNNQFVVKNFIGEKIPRILDLNNGVKVSVNGEEIVVEGIDKEMAGLMAGRIPLRIRSREMLPVLCPGLRRHWLLILKSFTCLTTFN